MDLEKIIETVKMVGAATPAFIELFAQVKTLVSETDQAKLQTAYDKAMANSDAAHQAAQNL